MCSHSTPIIPPGSFQVACEKIWGSFGVVFRSILGSFEKEALENEDRSTKHPKLKTEHLRLENEAPKTRNLSVL